MIGDPRRALGRRLLRLAGERLEALEDLLEPFVARIGRLADALEGAALACPLREGILDPAKEKLFEELARALGATLVAHITCARLVEKRREQKDFVSLAESCRQLLKDIEGFLIELARLGLDPEPRVRFPFSLFIKRATHPLLARRVPRSAPLEEWPSLESRAAKLLKRAEPWLERPAVLDDDILMAELLAGHPGAKAALKELGLMCWDCVVVCEETLAEAAAYHPFDKAALLARLTVSGDAGDEA